jgi:uncharacterized membrane protein YiaA
MNALRVLGELLLAGGVLSAAFGLWCAAGGLRVVVSNRMDEQKQSGKSARFAVLYIVLGLVLAFVGLWLAGWAGA